MSNQCLKQLLPYISAADADEMVGISEVQLSKDKYFLECCKCCIQRQLAFVANDEFNEDMVINARTQGAVFLLQKKKSLPPPWRKKEQ